MQRRGERRALGLRRHARRAQLLLQRGRVAVRRVLGAAVGRDLARSAGDLALELEGASSREVELLLLLLELLGLMGWG